MLFAAIVTAAKRRGAVAIGAFSATDHVRVRFELTGLEHHLQHQLEHAQAFFWHRLRWRVVAEYLPRDRPLVLVDVGAGTGLLGEFLERARPNVTYRFV